jgi:hypothetical protein
VQNYYRPREGEVQTKQMTATKRQDFSRKIMERVEDRPPSVETRTLLPTFLIVINPASCIQFFIFHIL